MSSSINGQATSVLFSTGSIYATWQCVDSVGFAYCNSTGREPIIKTNGVTYSAISPTNNGTMVAVTPERLVLAGFAAAPSRVDFSKANDFTTWTVGGNPTDPITFTITAPGSKITHITYAFNRLMWFKDSSFGYILTGPSLADWQVRTVSPNIGTLSNTSVYWDGMLYFKGQDSHIYAFDGSNISKITRDIQTTISVSQNRTTNFWTQTTQSDFQAGATSIPGWISTGSISGSLVLDSTSPVTPFTDTDGADFAAGTLTNLSTTTVPGSIVLSTLTFIDAIQSSTNTSIAMNGTSFYGQSFIINSTGILTGIQSVVSSVIGLGELTIGLYSDSANSPGSLLTSTKTTPVAGISLTTFTFSSPYTVLTSTRYWVGFSGDKGTNVFRWYYSSTNPYSNGAMYYSGSIQSGDDASFRIFVASYVSSGNLVSQVFDVGITTASWLWNWSTFNASGTIPSGTTLTYETQTSSSATGTFTTLATVSSGSVPTSTVQRYIRYKASFATTIASTSPVLNYVSLAMTNRIRPSGSFYSQVKNAPNLTAWDTIAETYQNNGGLVQFNFRASTNTFSVLSSTPNFVSVAAGSVPLVSTGTYFQVRVDIDALGYQNTPKLDDFTVNWLEGIATDKSYGVYHDDAIWFSVTSGTSSTTNNRIIRYDLINKTLTLYDIANNGMLVRDQSLYFGSSTEGKIYKYGDSESDAGSAINAYWKSKDFIGDSPFTDKEYVYILTQTNSVAASSMTVTYTVNGSSSNSYTNSLYTSDALFTKRNRNLPLGTIGSTFNIKFGNNAVDQPFELFGIQYGIRPKPWKPQ